MIQSDQSNEIGIINKQVVKELQEAINQETFKGFSVLKDNIRNNQQPFSQLQYQILLTIPSKLRTQSSCNLLPSAPEFIKQGGAVLLK